MKTLSGFVDNGKGAPLPGISAIVTRVTDGGIVTSGLTNADGEWLFSGLPESDEYLVNLSDGNGNAIVRGPWAGEIRSAFVRDRLALPDSGLAVLPNGGNTTVGGLPLVLDPNPANVLAWGPAGLYSAGSVGLTQALADTLYEPLDSAWTKSESDLRYSPIDAVVDAYTKAESDARYPQKTDIDPYPNYLTLTEGDGRYPLKTDPDPYPTYLTASEADALFLTPAEGNAAYATSAHNHDTTYVQLSGGSVMTGLLGPTSTNTRDLGTTALRWRKLWSVDGEFTNVPTVGGTSLDSRYALTAHNHDASYVLLTGGSVMTGLLGPSTHNTRDLGTTGTRWRALYGMTGDFTTSLTVATKPITPSPDAANIIEFRANGLYAAAGAVTDIWVNTLGDTMTGDLNMTANVLPTVTNVRSLGSTSLRWLKVWATDADFTNAPTVGGAALLTATAADALFLTPAEGNAAYATAAHNHDTTYVQLAGGSVMTGLLGPTTTNTRDLGTTALRWRKLWAVDGDLSGVLGVTGLATLGAGAAVTGATTTTTLSVNSRPVIMAGCRVYHSALQTITTATTTALAFNSERYDTDAFHDLVTNNSRLTVPAGHAGKYTIFASIFWAAATDANWRLLGIRLNGTTFIGRQSGPGQTTSTGQDQNVSVVYDLAAGDYVEAMVRHERGSNLDVQVSGNYSPEFGLQRIG